MQKCLLVFMEKILCSIRDVKANTFGAPVLFSTPLDAVRAFSDLLSNKDTLYGKHHSDFQLVYLADWDEVTGTLKVREHIVLTDGANFGANVDA